jgi:hypothetical protein
LPVHWGRKIVKAPGGGGTVKVNVLGSRVIVFVAEVGDEAAWDVGIDAWEINNMLGGAPATEDARAEDA